jgi:hypothetical protein
MVASLMRLGLENDYAGEGQQQCRLVRENALHQQTRNCLTVKKMWL